uniref:Uncharacterized protein n=1 Tax=Anguilla anguilla TaxID=7936 RepID=A0A0E9WQP2_ANGAN
MPPCTVTKTERKAKNIPRPALFSGIFMLSSCIILVGCHLNKHFGRVAQKQPLQRATCKFKCLTFAKHHWNYNFHLCCGQMSPNSFCLVAGCTNVLTQLEPFINYCFFFFFVK